LQAKFEKGYLDFLPNNLTFTHIRASKVAG
jgi:hypothetical protein